MSLKPETLQIMQVTEGKLVSMMVRDVTDVFSTMVGIDDLLHLPIQIDVTRDFQDCVTAMVGLAGQYNGLVSIHIPSPLAMNITSQMLGMEVSEINQDVNDALGEIANMVAGCFKQHFSKGGSDVRISIPSVVYGADYTFSPGTLGSDNLTLKFAADEEWFMVALTLEE